MKRNWMVKMIAFAIVTVIVMAAVVMYLWNWLVPELFHGPVISYLQAVGIMLLCRILFRGFHGMKNKGMYGKWNNWKDHLEKMSPEEREKMRELWKKRCGGFGCEDEMK